MATKEPNRISKDLYKGEVTLFYYPSSHRYRVIDRKVGPEERWVSMSPSGAVEWLDKPYLIKWAVKLAKDALLELHKKNGFVTIPQIEEAATLHTLKKEEGGNRGQLVHDFIEAYANWQMEGSKGEQPTYPDADTKVETDKVHNACRAFLKLVQDEDMRFVVSEGLVYSRENDFAGKTDSVFTCKRTNHETYHIFDAKSGKVGEVWAEESGRKRKIGLCAKEGDRFQTSGYLGSAMEESNYSLGDKAPAWGDRLIAYLGKEDAEFTPLWLGEFEEDYSVFKALCMVGRRMKYIEKANKAEPPIVV